MVYHERTLQNFFIPRHRKYTGQFKSMAHNLRKYKAYRGFCSSSSVSVGSGVFEAPLSLSFLPDGLFTSVFSAAAKFVALSLPPDLDEADCGLTVSGSSTRGKRAWSLTASHGILPENTTR